MAVTASRPTNPCRDGAIMDSLRLPERAMTQRFPRSRLAEIAEAAPVQPVAFPNREEIAVMRCSLQRMRELFGRPVADPSGPDPAVRVGASAPC